MDTKQKLELLKKNAPKVYQDYVTRTRDIINRQLFDLRIKYKLSENQKEKENIVKIAKNLKLEIELYKPDTQQICIF